MRASLALVTEEKLNVMSTGDAGFRSRSVGSRSVGGSGVSSGVGGVGRSSGSSRDDFVDYLSPHGLEMLEAELLARLRRVQARRRSLARGAPTVEDDAEYGVAEDDDDEPAGVAGRGHVRRRTARKGARAGSDAGAATAGAAGASSSLEQALQRMLQRSPPIGARGRGGDAAAAGPTETQLYADRLAAEARTSARGRQRAGASDEEGDGDEDEDEDEDEDGELARPRGLADLLGLAPGDGGQDRMVQMKVFMAPNADGAEGGEPGVLREIELGGAGSLLQFLEGALKGSSGGESEDDGDDDA